MFLNPPFPVESQIHSFWQKSYCQ